MLKLIGSGLVVLASVGIAYGVRCELVEHLKLLYVLRKLLLDISYAAYESLQPVEILLGCFVKTKDARVNRMCGEMAEQLMEKQEGDGEAIWRNMVASYRNELQLNEEEEEVLASAGAAFFGKSMEENRNHLSLVIERLDFLIGAAREERKEKEKVYGTLCVLSGLMIVILLI